METDACFTPRDDSDGFYSRLKKDERYRSMFVRKKNNKIYDGVEAETKKSQGWVESLAGPTFPDLRELIQEDLDTASWLFTGTSLGFLTGSILTGILYNKVKTDLLLTISIIGTALAITAVPWCPSFYLMLIVKVVAGVLGASHDTAGNAQVVSMWRNDAGPYMQAAHFCFSLGGMIAPLVAQPFLASDACLSAVGKINGFKAENASYPEHNYINDSKTQNLTWCLYEETRIQYAYLVSGILIAVTSLPFLISCLTSNKIPGRESETNARNDDKTGFGQLSLPMKAFILVLLSALMALYCGTEDTFAGFLTTFLVSELRWSKSNGAFATSVYWICFGLSRLAGILIVRLAKTSTLLFIYSFSLVISITGLLISTIFRVDILVWIFIGTVGCSLSIIFASIFTWTTENITQVAGKISAMFMSSASFGVILFPLLFGYTMKWLSPMWFLYLLLGQSVVWICLFALTRFITRHLIATSSAKMEINIPEKEPLST